MVIRKAEIKDIPQLSDMLLQVLTVHHNGRPDIFKENARKYNEKELLIILKNENTPVFVSADDNDIAQGYAFCILKHTADDNILTDIKTLYIDDLCVDENCRCRGIGKALYEFVLAYAKKLGCYNVTLNVWSCNKSAYDFYIKCGLVPQKTGLEKIL